MHFVVAEHDRHSPLGGGLGDDVDRGRLELDEVEVGRTRLERREVCPKLGSAREVPGDVNDLGAVLAAEVLAEACVRRGWRGREVRDPTSADVADRARPEDRLQHGHLAHLGDRPPHFLHLVLVGQRLFATREDDEVAEKDPVGAEVADDRGRVLGCADHEDALAGFDGRDRRTASFEDDQVRRKRRCQLGRRAHVGVKGRAREPPSRAAAADRDDARESRALEVVRGGVAART